DRLDARLIAEYVAIMPTRVVQRDAAAEKLAEIVTMRRQLCDEHVAAENQAAHSITSSARSRNDSGIVRPSAFAVVRLMTRSNLVGCSTGRADGFAPCKILSTKSAARRNRSGMFGP